MQDKTLTIVMKAPDSEPEIHYIKDDFRAMQEIVGGHFEVVPKRYGDGVVICCNEEGKLLGLKENVVLLNSEGVQVDILVGTIFAIGTDYKNSNFISLTEKQIDTFIEYFSNGYV